MGSVKMPPGHEQSIADGLAVRTNRGPLPDDILLVDYNDRLDDY